MPFKVVGMIFCCAMELTFPCMLFNIRVGLRSFHYVDLMYELILGEEQVASASAYLIQMARLLEEELVGL